jgi:hypothetical protein
MNSKKQIASLISKNKNGRALAATLSSIFLLSRAADTPQEIASPPPSEIPNTEPVSQETQTNEFEVFNPESENGTVPRSSLPQPFKWGWLTVRPHALYQFVYATGILSTPGAPQKTTIQTFSPGILFDLGDHWSLDYTPTLRFYSNRNFQNEFDNSVTLSGQTSYENWNFGLLQSYVSSEAPLVETGTQTEQENYSTALTASDVLNDKMSLDLGAYQNLQLTEDFQSSRDWSTLDWLNYEFWPRLTAGVGAGAGYVNVNFGPDQTYEQLAGRVNWRATDKISFQINGGAEDRQFLGGAGDLISPTFGAAIQYQPFDETRISLNASRNIAPSYFADEVEEDTVVGADFNQRLLQKFYLDLNAAYNWDKYVASANGISANREDDYYSLTARLSHPFLKRGTAAVFYEYSGDASTAAGFSYISHQIGVEIGFNY